MTPSRTRRTAAGRFPYQDLSASHVLPAQGAELAITTTAAEPAFQVQRFKQLFEGLPVLAALVTPTGKLLGCSLPLASTAPDEPQDTTSALSLGDLPLWGGDALIAERLQRALTRCVEGRNVREEMPFHRSANETGILDLHLSPIVSQQGTVREIMCLGIDQTALVRTHTNLRASERRFQEMTHALPMMIWVSNANGECMFANRSYVEFFGARRNAITSAPETAEPVTAAHDWLVLVHPDDTDFCEHYKRSVDSRVPFRREVLMKNTLGQWRHLECFCRPNYDPTGIFTGFTCTSVDLTEQYLARKSIADSDRRKDEFLATLAHELRNPLAPILTGVELIKQLSGQSATIDNALEIIERQSRQMSLLIDDLMDASRISQGNFELRKFVVRLDDLVQEAVETCGPAIDEARHKLTVALPPEPVWLKVDPLRITQVLTNLLKNATKFTNKGGDIKVSMRESDVCLIVSVNDNGRGFAPDTIDRVFDMYTQLNKRPINGDVGLGVGLALSKYLINRHGGCLDVVSDGLGSGSTFSMHLPLTLKSEPGNTVQRPVFTQWVNNERRSDESSRLLAAVTVPDIPESGYSHDDARRQQPGRADGAAIKRADASAVNDGVDEKPTPVLKVLVVDDNEDAAFIISELLEHLGVETLIAHTGGGALSQFEAFEPDLVLLDIGLPDIDGYAVARSIRQSGAHGRRVRLVALTGLGGPDDKKKSLESGFDEHRVKPLSLVHLGPLVQQLRRQQLIE